MHILCSLWLYLALLHRIYLVLLHCIVLILLYCTFVLRFTFYALLLTNLFIHFEPLSLFLNVLTLFAYVFVSAEEDSDESKVLCEIKTKSSDLSLLLSWKWCETDNNIVISIFLLFFFMPLPLGELCQVQWWGKWVKVGHTRQTKKNSKTWEKRIVNRILRVLKLIEAKFLFVEFFSAFQFFDNRYTVTLMRKNI